ncbi:MAG: PilC/PilY family type IV pilus protein, partial [Candidatus Eisenbacteria bacterium]
GYDTTTAQTNLLVLNPSDGSTLSTIALGSPVKGNKTTKGTAIDMDFDGYDDLLYLGDLTGRIWRVDLTTNPWSATVLYNCGKPIQAPPVLTEDTNGHVMVFFGTGKYLTMADPPDTTSQQIYGIIDDNSGTTISSSSLVDQTTTFHSMSGKRGWFMNLAQGAGERVTHSAALIAGTLYVPSFRPNYAACTGGAQSWLYSLDYKDGSAPDNTNGTSNNTTAGRVQSMGDGILADPSVDLLSQQVILQSSNAVLLTEDISQGVKKLVVHSWRQKWN